MGCPCQKKQTNSKPVKQIQKKTNEIDKKVIKRTAK